MTGLPYFKFDVSEYLTGTIQMCSLETQGVFVNLCARMWKNGGTLPDDDVYLCRLLHCDKPTFSRARAELDEFGILATAGVDGCSIKFITEQLDELSATHTKRVESGRKGGQAKQLARASRAKAGLKPGSSIKNKIEKKKKIQNKNTPIPPRGASSSFDIWWNEYPNKIGKGYALKCFKKALKQATLEELREGVQRYIKSKPDDRPWCNPSTWLNQGRWKDEPAQTGTATTAPQETDQGILDYAKQYNRMKNSGAMIEDIIELARAAIKSA